MPKQLKKAPYHPLFSHQFQSSLLPASSFTIAAYPACIDIIDSKTDEITRSLRFLPEFRFLELTTRLDLLKREVVVEGVTPRGFQRLSFIADKAFWFLKSMKKELRFFDELGKDISLKRGESLPLFPATSWIPSEARLVLTSPKKNRWESLQDHFDWKTLVEQFYLCKGDPLPWTKKDDSLLTLLSKEISCGSKTQAEHVLKELLSRGFSGMCVPKVGEKVAGYFGRPFWPSMDSRDNLTLLQELLRSLFLQEEKDTLILLPSLLPSLLSGHIVQERCFNQLVTLSFCWGKGKVFQVFLRAGKDCDIKLRVSGCDRVRLRTIHQKNVRQEKLEDVLSLKKDETYLLDKFL